MEFDFEIHDNVIQIYFGKEVQFKSVFIIELFIRKDIFFNWVVSEGRDEYVFNYFEDGQHKEFTGKYTLESYFDIDQRDIEKDIREFIYKYK
jgi:hypothetical protein